jgi:hypothetical protein
MEANAQAKVALYAAIGVLSLAIGWNANAMSIAQKTKTVSSTDNNGHRNTKILLQHGSIKFLVRF